MSCNFEVEVLTHRLIPVRMLMEKFERGYTGLELVGISEACDFTFENLRAVEKAEIHATDESIEMGRVVVVRGDYLQKPCGFTVHKDKDRYRYSFWVQKNDEDDVYDAAVDFVTDFFDPHNVDFAAMGYEMLMPRDFPAEMYTNSTIHTWVLAETYRDLEMKNFKRYEKKGFCVFSRV